MNTDNNEKRARFDALPSPEVSSEAVRNIPVAGGGYVSRIVDWLKSMGVLGQYKNDETGWDNIAVCRTSVKSVVHHGAGVGKIALLEAAPALIKNGVYLETNPKNDQRLTSHIFAGKATIDGTQYAVSFVVREDQNGRRYYDHSLTKIETLDRIDDQAPLALTSGKNEGLRLQTTRPDVKSTGEKATDSGSQTARPATNTTGEITDRKSTGTPQLTGPSAQPAGEETTVNILKKHLGVNTPNKL